MASVKSKKGRKYYIPTPKHMDPRPRYIRDKIILKYRALLEGGGYRNVRIFKQIFKVMRVCSNDKEYITAGEFVVIMRNKLDTSLPVRGELTYLSCELCRFRKWLGAVAGMVVYVKHERLSERDFQGLEWIYRPIRNKTEYRNISKHFARIQSGLKSRDDENSGILSMSHKEIERRIKEAEEEIDLEAEGYRDKK